MDHEMNQEKQGEGKGILSPPPSLYLSLFLPVSLIYTKLIPKHRMTCMILIDFSFLLLSSFGAIRVYGEVWKLRKGVVFLFIILFYLFSFFFTTNNPLIILHLIHIYRENTFRVFMCMSACQWYVRRQNLEFT